MGRIGETCEGPETDGLVGLDIEDPRRLATTLDGVAMNEEMEPNRTYTLDHREDRLRLRVVDDVVVTAAR